MAFHQGFEMNLPGLLHVSQKISGDSLPSVESSLQKTLESTHLLVPVEAGQRVVIAVGSRGIPNYGRVIHYLIHEIHRRGANAVLLPAMGSHGGGYAEGQVEILADLGIGPGQHEADVIDSMDVIELGQTDSGIRVLVDRALLSCDHIVVVNRIKEHTEFSGEIQSGLLKMMAIGFGRTQGAVEAHRCAVTHGYEQTIKEIFNVYSEKLPLLGGVAILDSPDGGTAHVEAVLRQNMPETEASLLGQAQKLTPKLPLDRLDILIVDEIGKDISGTGMDTKVIGRIMNVYEPEPDTPKITRILVRDLTAGTHGNALGIGLADFTTRRLVAKVNYAATNLNCITAITPEKARIPMTFETDREALEAALSTIGPWDENGLRLLWIKNTSALMDFWATPAAVSAMGPQRVDIVNGPRKLVFTSRGELIPFNSESASP